MRTAAEGATEEELTARRHPAGRAVGGHRAARRSRPTRPTLLYGEPDLTIKVVRDIFNEDFSNAGRLRRRARGTWSTSTSRYVAPDLADRLRAAGPADRTCSPRYRIDEQLAKALDRKVWLPSGGSLVIDRTEAMTVVDVNTGKFTGQGGNLEETVTTNNLEAAEEIVRQLRLRDIGGIIVIDFIDMVLESNRDLVLRRLVECLGRDRTKHQVAEVTSLGLVQMTRKRIGPGLLEAFSEHVRALQRPRAHRVLGAGRDRPPARRGGQRPPRAGRPSPQREAGAAGGRCGGKQTGKTPPPPKFDEHGRLEHAEHASHEDHDDAVARGQRRACRPTPSADGATSRPRADGATRPTGSRGSRGRRAIADGHEAREAAEAAPTTTRVDARTAPEAG